MEPKTIEDGEFCKDILRKNYDLLCRNKLLQDEVNELKDRNLLLEVKLKDLYEDISGGIKPNEKNNLFLSM